MKALLLLVLLAYLSACASLPDEASPVAVTTLPTKTTPQMKRMLYSDILHALPMPIPPMTLPLTR